MESESSKIERFERAKLLHDYFKYMTVLCTGSATFLVTFYEKFDNSTGALNWFAATLVAFMVSAVSSVLAQTSYIWYASSPGSILGNKTVYLTGLAGSLLGFISGVVFLLVFALQRISIVNGA